MQAARIEAGVVLFPANASWLSDYLFELLAFPNARHDDQVDSTSQFLKWRSQYKVFCVVMPEIFYIKSPFPF